MSGIDLLPELGERLDRLVPAETTVGPGLGRHRPARRPDPARGTSAKRRRLRPVLIAVALFLLLAGIATGTFFALRGGGDDKAAALTIFTGDPIPPPSTRLCRKFGCGPEAAIGAVQPDSRLEILWRCPHPGYFCGDMTSMAWSADGRKLAFTMDEIGGQSAYVGLHIMNVLTGRDHQLPSAGKGDPARQRSRAFFVRFGRRSPSRPRLPVSRTGGVVDRQQLSHTCAARPGLGRGPVLFVLPRRRSHRRLVRTAMRLVASPSLSPDGTRVAFATGTRPLDSNVYVVNLDGSGRSLVARDAAGDPRGRRTGRRSPTGRSAGYGS